MKIYCPITHDPIVDPVMTPGGHTYEGSAIREWVSRNGTSPFTKNPVRMDQLVRNYALAEIINQLGEIEEVNEIEESPSYNPLPIETTYTVDPGTRIGELFLQAPNGPGVPCSIVLVIDVSYSMVTQISTDVGGTKESHGLSQLDIVKHGAKTAIANMRDCDSVGIVSYSTSAQIVLPLTRTTTSNKKMAMALVDALRLDADTNIWDGLKKGFQVLECSDRNSLMKIMLLTDGVSTINPPSGTLTTLRNYVSATPWAKNVVIDTFGLGYEMDVELLNSISEGTGSYTFIPDGSLVGSIFIDAISNTLTTVGWNTRIAFDGFEVVDAFPVNHGEMYCGTIHAGQTRSILFYSRSDTLKVRFTSFGSLVEKELQAGFMPLADKLVRSNCIALMQRAVLYAKNRDYQLAQDTMKSGIRNPVSSNIVDDMLDQGVQAVSENYFGKWGYKYILSLIGAHLNFRCNNFKDHVQDYGGEPFKALRVQCESVFLSIPPPKPTHKSRNVLDHQSFSSYHNADGGCMIEGSMVEMYDGSSKPIESLKKHDLVKTPFGVSSVLCLVSSAFDGTICRVGHLGITPWHPIRVGGVWAFPTTNHKTEQYDGNVYNLFLSTGHIAVIDNIECVTLAHNYHDPVVRHEYFGTNRVKDDFSRLVGWNTGLVSVNPFGFVRSGPQNTISGYNQ